MTRLRGSRLRKARATKTLTVVDPIYNDSTGQINDTTIYASLVATYQQKEQTDYSDDWGRRTRVVEIFRFERLESTGALPVIEERYELIDSDNTRYKIERVVDLAGRGERLKVTCERYKNTITS